ncbi:PrsW family glutamic-type intramembrane protease [Streptomyces sp. ODS28]|uniref:PrsW family intramembrane metalloprotease n=1 Tax=Streptomyces sp. ODS28 TaxID=3136688 RepID=UPI0031EA7004
MAAQHTLGDTRPAQEPHPPRHRAWLTVFLTGLALWVLTVVVTFATGNANLLPTLVFLGSFLVPVTFVTWAFDHTTRGTAITPRRLLAAFLVGGTLGVLGASVLEDYFLHPSAGMFAGVGLIEEGVKLVALWLVARGLPRYGVRDGLVLGAAVGFGFAALESSGYALTALFTVKGLSLDALVQTEILRGLLAPFGHGLWTAILGGVLFAGAAYGGSAREGRLRLTWPLICAYVGVAGLHALWDAMHGIAVALTARWTASPYQAGMLERGYLPRPTQEQANLVLALQIAGWVVITAVALAWLGALVRARAPRTDRRVAPGGWGA